MDVKQDELAVAINISKPTLSKIENGSDFSLATLEKICLFFKKDISYVLPTNNNVFNFNESPNSNGNYNNYANKELIEILQKDIEQKNNQLTQLISKLK